MTNRNKNKNKNSTDSPSKEPLMSPARGIIKNKNAKLKAECTVPSPNHARYNASFKSASSSPNTSPRHHLLGLSDDHASSCDIEETVTVSEHESQLTDTSNCQVLIERSPSPAASVAASPVSPQALTASLAGSRTSIRGSAASVASTNKLGSSSPRGSAGSSAKLSHENVELSPTEQQQLQQEQQGAKKGEADAFSVQGDLSSRSEAICNKQQKGKQQKEKQQKQQKIPSTAKSKKDKQKCNGSLKTTQSDTVLLSNGHVAQQPSRQAHSASSLQPLMVEGDPRFKEYLYATGTVKRGNNWTGEQMRADMVDLSERYAQPNTVLSLGIVALVVGSVSLILSFSSSGMRMWSHVGCTALGIGAVLIIGGSGWYYARSRLVYACEPDVEIKVVSGSETANSKNTNGNPTVPGHKITGV